MNFGPLLPAAFLSLAGNAALAQAAPDQPAQVMREVTVSGTGVTDDYAATRATAATKTDTPLLETPIAVQVVPQQVLSDRAERTVLEAAHNVSGVQSATYQFYDQLLIRGFDSDYGNLYRDGLQLQGINEAINTAFVDRVEVIKGPSSTLYGRIEPGGFVNVVTKKPQTDPAYSVDLQYGSWRSLRMTGDATGRLSEDGRLAYRAIADYDEADSWVDNMHRNNKAVSLGLAWKPSARFDSLVQLEHYDYATAWLDASIPIIGDRPAPLPRNFSMVFPQSWSDYPYTVRRDLVSVNWTLKLGDRWSLTNRFHGVRSSENQQGVYATWWLFDGVSSVPAVHFTHSSPDWIRTTVGTNLDLKGEFDTAGIRHTLIAGLDWARFTNDTPGSDGDIALATPFDVFHPVYTDLTPVLKSLAATDASNILWRDWSRDLGMYFQDQLAIGERWRLLAGGRYDWAADAYATTYGDRSAPCYPHCTGEPFAPYPTDRAFSPKFGALYRASRSISVYGSFSKSFGASSGVDQTGHALKPQIGKQFEAGAKAELFDGAATTSLTVFDLTKSNITEYDPVNFFPRLVGEARSRGVELDLAGSLSRHWSGIASYTYDQAKLTRDPYYGNEGNRLSGVAPQVLSVWAKYDSVPEAHEGYVAGAGIYLMSRREGDDANTWQLPGYGRLDLMAAYRRPLGRCRFSAQININNVLDRIYFEHGGSGIAAYGAPRTAIGSLRLDL